MYIILCKQRKTKALSVFRFRFGKDKFSHVGLLCERRNVLSWNSSTSTISNAKALLLN